MTILIGVVIALVAFCLGFALGCLGASEAYNNGYKDASYIYNVPTWTYKKTIKRKKK